jgi:hypothetical protein
MNFDLLLPNIQMYPYTESEYNLCDRPNTPEQPLIDRIQIQFSETRCAMLVRHIHSLHWCGYVPLRVEDWDRIEKIIRRGTIQITFAGFGNQYITWMTWNQDGRLKAPVHVPVPALASAGEADFWIGFDMLRNSKYEIATSDEAMARLVQLETLVYQVRNN